jgi:acetoin utilization deacetylase AcuC-like enzyme
VGTPPPLILSARSLRRPYSGVMRAVYHPSYQIVLPPGHPFPMSKYSLLRDQLLAEGTLRPATFCSRSRSTLRPWSLVHTPEYLAKLSSAALSAAEQRRLGLPWSEALWQRSLLASAGTLLAAREALDRTGGNLAGGTHHAFADHGEGFCVLNDVAIAIRQLQAERAIGGRRSSTSTCIKAMAPRPSSNRMTRCSPSPCTARRIIPRRRCAPIWIWL